MTDRHETTWADNLLAIVIVAVGIYAGGLVLVGRFIGDEVFGPLGFGPGSGGINGGEAHDYTTFIFGVLGAVIMGWMVLAFIVARGPLRRRQPWAWGAVAASIGVWFVADTGFSIVVGQDEHALFNVGFLVAIAVPLIALRREMKPIPGPSVHTPSRGGGDVVTTRLPGRWV
jgi:hypothetical protein